MTDAKKKMSSRKFMAIFLPVTAVLLITSIVITCVMEYWSTVMDAVFGEAKISIEAAPGTENWDTDYYGLNAEGMTPEQKAAEGAELARRAEGEGIVLLKNQNNALPLTGNGQPLSESNTITVNALGWSFYYPSTGGSGSGAVGSDGLVSPKEALAAAGIQINEELENYYLDWSNHHYTEWMVTKANGYYTDEDTNTEPARPSVSKAYQAAWDVPELNAQLVAEACDQSDAAANNVQIVWIGRGGGEYHDCPTVMTKEGGSVNTYGVNPDKHYLELTDEEEAVLAKAEELRGDDGKVIVIINANNTMELGELADDDKVDAILFVGGPGKQGFYAIGDVLNGTVNPSGRLADTYAADLLANPAMENFSSKVYYDPDAAFPNQYDTMIDYTDADGSTSQRPIMFVGYEEGIYVGYRFYESAAADGFFTSDQLPEGVTDPYYNRENGVIYPFGYGLSYTTFTQEISKASYADGVFTFDVTVKNTGSVAGKDVVELYVETPYTPGGIEKSKVVLCGFDKTDILDPGAEQTMTITVKAEDLASYDDTVNRCYVLDSGDYTFYLGTVDGTVYGSHSWAYATPADSADAAGANAVTFAAADAISKTIIYNDEHDGKRESDETTATNAFDREMTGNNLKVTNGDATMNRADGFAASWPTAPQAEDTVMPEELKTILDDNNYSTKEATALHDEDVEMPVTGQDAGLQLINLRGLSYDDPLWETYIQQHDPLPVGAQSGFVMGQGRVVIEQDRLVVAFVTQQSQRSGIAVSHQCNITGQLNKIHRLLIKAGHPACGGVEKLEAVLQGDQGTGFLCVEGPDALGCGHQRRLFAADRINPDQQVFILQGNAVFIHQDPEGIVRLEPTGLLPCDGIQHRKHRAFAAGCPEGKILSRKATLKMGEFPAGQNFGSLPGFQVVQIQAAVREADRHPAAVLVQRQQAVVGIGKQIIGHHLLGMSVKADGTAGCAGCCIQNDCLAGIPVNGRHCAAIRRHCQSSARICCPQHCTGRDFTALYPVRTGKHQVAFVQIFYLCQG